MTKHNQHTMKSGTYALRDGIHLSPPDYRLPFHGCGDASNYEKSFGLNQYNDLPPGTDFTVHSHSPTETIVRLTITDRTHTSPKTTPAVFTLPGGLNAGLMLTANARLSTLNKLTLSCG
jgi:hypothetical protein